MKLSVIVPVYNVLPYLRKCVGSLLKQDLPEKDYEIILVDDGSIDGSGALCDELSGGNVKVLHQENKGLGAARNAGLLASTGEYVQYVDSDDFLEENVLGTLVSKMEKEALEVLRFNYQNVNEAYEVYEPYKDVKPFVDYSEDVCTGLEFLGERLGTACYAVQFIMRSGLAKSVLFKTGVYFEDTEWTPRMLVKASRVSSTPMMVYNYLLREGSITRATDETKRKKILEDKFSLIESLDNQSADVADTRWFGAMKAQTAKTALDCIIGYPRADRKACIERLKAFNVFPLSHYHSTKSFSRKLSIINFSPELYCLLMKIKNR